MPPSAHWLSLSIWVPIVAGLAVLATGADKNAREARIIALVGAGLGFLVTIPLVAGFDTGTSAMQFVEKAPWIERFNEIGRASCRERVEISVGAVALKKK